MTVKESLGGLDSLIKLIEKAKSAGISIILDGVFNHTGDDSLYFNKYSSYNSVGAYQSKSSPYYNWFTFKDHPDEYECWWNIKILPRLRLENLDCNDFFLSDNGVISKYMHLGILGFRLDVCDELPESFIKGIKARQNMQI